MRVENSIMEGRLVLSLLALVCLLRPVSGASYNTFFNWDHASRHTSDIKNYVLANFHTDTTAAFGWKVHDESDSLSLARDPDGSGYVLKVFYKSGTFTDHDSHGHSCGSSPCQRGAQFYVMPPTFYRHGKTFAALEYEVYFADGFDFADGGKLPGLFGGSRDSCKGCSGEGRTCFSSRLMWRTGGQGEVYSYQPYNQEGGWSSWCRKYKNDNHKIICSDHGCGTEIGKTSSGGFYFAPKKWYRIREEVNLGHVNQAGRISLWVDGNLKVNMNHIVLRRSSSVHIDGIFFSTFYGGNDRSYGRHGDTYAYFKNFKLTDEKYTNHNGEYFVG